MQPEHLCNESRLLTAAHPQLATLSAGFWWASRELGALIRNAQAAVLISQMSRVIPWSEIEKHADISSCWVVIHGKVYDLTAFVSKVSCRGSVRGE